MKEIWRCVHDKEDQTPGCVEPCLGYSAVLVAECLEVISELDDKVIHNDLLVGSYVPWSLIFPHSCLSALSK